MKKVQTEKKDKITAEKLNNMGLEELIMFYNHSPEFCQKYLSVTADNEFKDLATNAKKNPKRLEEVSRSFFTYSEKQKIDLFKANTAFFFKIVNPYYHKKLSKELPIMPVEEKEYIQRLYPDLFKTAEKNFDIKKISTTIDNLKPEETMAQLPNYLPKSNKDKYLMHCLINNHYKEIEKYIDTSSSFLHSYYKEAYMDKSKIITPEIERIILKSNPYLIFVSNLDNNVKKDFINKHSLSPSFYFSPLHSSVQKENAEIDKFMLKKVLLELNNKMPQIIIQETTKLFNRNSKLIDYIYEISHSAAKTIFSLSVKTSQMDMNYAQSLYMSGFSIKDEELLYKPVTMNINNYIKKIPIEETLFIEKKYEYMGQLNAERIQNEEVFAAGIYNIQESQQSKMESLKKLNSNMSNYLLKNIKLSAEIQSAIEQNLLKNSLVDSDKKNKQFKI